MPEETKNEVVTETAAPEEAPETDEDFGEELSYDPDTDEDWDNVKWGENVEVDDSGEEESETAEPEEADQPKTEESGKPADEPPAEKPAEAEDADQWIELKHMDDPPRKVSKKEATELAQKGLDYDRIREERDTLKSNLPRYEEMEAFLKEMQGDFSSIEDFMDDTRARIRSDAEGISYSDALAKVKAARAPKQQPQQPADTGLQSSAVDEFVARYPGVKAEDIPASVWAEVRQTGNLVSAYEKYDTARKNDRIAALELEIETLKNNKKNSERSTGSSKSSGVSSQKSLIASLWDADD